jgi:hypothetical protein
MNYRIVFLALIALVVPAKAQEHRAHPVADLPLHEKFYSSWYMPDQPTKSCCNKADCYPTEVRVQGDMIFARRREDGKWLLVPSHKVERHRDNPDGRSTSARRRHRHPLIASAGHRLLLYGGDMTFSAPRRHHQSDL